MKKNKTFKISDFMNGKHKSYKKKENSTLWLILTIAVIIASIKLGINILPTSTVDTFKMFASF